METQFEIGVTFLLLVVMTLLSTVDMAFGQLSDVGLRRLIRGAEVRSARPSCVSSRGD